MEQLDANSPIRPLSEHNGEHSSKMCSMKAALRWSYRLRQAPRKPRAGPVIVAGNCACPTCWTGRPLLSRDSEVGLGCTKGQRESRSRCGRLLQGAGRIPAGPHTSWNNPNPTPSSAPSAPITARSSGLSDRGRGPELICGGALDDQLSQRIWCPTVVRTWRVFPPPPNQNHDHNRHTEGNSMDLHLQTDWRRALGQLVEIRLQGQILRTGIVEAVMPDQSILWISAEGHHPREMVERADGKQIFARYPWDALPGSSRRSC